MDGLLVSASHAKKHRGVDSVHIYKIWNIKIEEAKRTLGVATQHIQITDNPNLSRKYVTKDRMLLYKRIT